MAKKKAPKVTPRDRVSDAMIALDKCLQAANEIICGDLSDAIEDLLDTSETSFSDEE
jgi:hypothetical protein